MRHSTGPRLLCAVVLLATGALAGADDMVMLAGPKSVQWGPAPASLPKVCQISLLAGDPSKPGPFTLRLKMPAGTVIAPHTHATPETVTVLSGTLYHEVGETLDKAKGSALTAGGFVSLPAGMAHSVWSTAPTILQVNGTGPFDLHYINPADDPRNAK